MIFGREGNLQAWRKVMGGWLKVTCRLKRPDQKRFMVYGSLEPVYAGSVQFVHPMLLTDCFIDRCTRSILQDLEFGTRSRVANFSTCTRASQV